MKKWIVLLLVIGGAYYFYQKREDPNNPATIDKPVYAEIRVGIEAPGRSLDMALFAAMANEEECRTRTQLVWDNVLSACTTCSSQVKDCRTALPARYAKLFSNVPIASTYLSLTRGAPSERDGRMVIYGLTAQEGNALCDQMKSQFATRYTGKLECIPSTQN
ncbi:MAG TPA: hypothetical protein VFS24_05295 [Steroidobacteraceae bacterium]|nr:hypothetical protein [Steroidobacteraceae bacterium]